MIDADERLAAHVVLAAGRPAHLSDKQAFAITSSVARARVTALLPPAWVPHSITVHCRPLPCTANGKLDRRGLLATSQAGEQEHGRHRHRQSTTDDRANCIDMLISDTPFGRLSSAVSACCRETLALPSVHADDNFVQLGADSLSAMRVCTRLKATLQPPQTAADEQARRTGNLAGAFAPSALLASRSLRAYCAQLAAELQTALTAEEEEWVAKEDTNQGDQPLPIDEALGLAAAANWAGAVQAALEHVPGAPSSLANVNGGWTRQRPVFTPLHAAARAGADQCLKVSEQYK